MRQMEEEQFMEECFVGANNACILKNSDDFSETDFQILQNQKIEGLVECRKLIYNGKIKLVFMTQNYQNIENLIKISDADGIQQICNHYIESILSIEKNGFLDLSCINRDLEHIWVDRDTYQVYFVYYPLKSRRDCGNRKKVEYELRNLFGNLLKDIKKEKDSWMLKYERELIDDSISLTDICKDSSVEEEKTALHINSSNEDVWSMEAIETNFKILVDKDEFLIGKSTEKADGVIQGNPAISRVHCRIIKDDTVSYIEDMASSNGTFVDGHRLLPNKKECLEDGMIIKIADMKFRVRRL